MPAQAAPSAMARAASSPFFTPPVAQMPSSRPLNWTTLDQPDPLLAVQQRASAGLKFGSTSRAFTTPTLNFDGQGNSFVSPPDTVGDIGPTYYIQMINGGSGTP